MLLAGALAAGETLAWPAALGGLGTLAYRVAYTLTLPLRPLVFLLLEPANDHGTVWHSVVLGLLVPPLGVAGVLLWRARPSARRRQRACEGSEQPSPTPGDSPEPHPDGGAPAAAAGPAHAAGASAAEGPEGTSRSRRSFLARAARVSALGLAAGAGAYAMALEPAWLVVRRYGVRIAGLPAHLNGLRMVHLSDTHYGPYVGLRFLRRVVRLANSLKPDLVALTGDYVHRTPAAIPEGIGVFAELRPRLGSVAVLGNHDHWEGAAACRSAFAAAGVRLVDNARLFVTSSGLLDGLPPAGADTALCLAGLGDLWEGDPDWRAALGAVAPETPRVVLAHNPDLAELVPAGLRVDLLLAGHTHGGQVRLPLLGAPFVPSRHGKRYLGGLCQGPRGPVVVSRGVGLAALPARLGVPPEVGLVTLHRSAQQPSP